MVRPHPTTNAPQLVLVDHGLYKTLPPAFRNDYCDLWIGIALADIPEIKRVCLKMNAGKMFPLLAAMLTARPFDEILDRQAAAYNSPHSPRVQQKQTKGDNSMIRQYAMRYMKEIAILLDSIPRELCLLLKMNDCLRHIDFALGRPVNTLEVSALRANLGKLQFNKMRAASLWQYFKSHYQYYAALFRIKTMFWYLGRLAS